MLVTKAILMVAGVAESIIVPYYFERCRWNF